MHIELTRRQGHSTWMALASPVLAIGLTLITGSVMFAAIGVSPMEALYVYFIEPLTAWWTVEELLIKAAPIILIAIGLSFCYLSNSWNIGAEGQLVAGAITGSILPILVPDFTGPLVLPLMLLMGIAGGMAWEHRDPVDRILVAQSTRRNFSLATRDKNIRAAALTQILKA